MSGIAQRRSRRDSTVGRKLELWKRMRRLGLILMVPIVGSSGEYLPLESRRRTNDENSSNAVVDPNDYCGTSWEDAYYNCPLPCPSGSDSDCAALGDGYTCHRFTACDENIGSGADNSNAIEGAGNPSSNISFPDCPVGYSLGGSSAYGTLVSYSTPGDSTENTPVYSCQGQPDCSAGPPGTDDGWTLIGMCPSSETAASVEPTQMPDSEMPPSPEVWWLNGGTTVECKFGNDYPPRYITDPVFTEQFLFDTEKDCCLTYPDACDVEYSTTVPSPAAPTSPTGAPSSLVPTYADTYAPTYESSAFVARWSFVFCIASIFVAFPF